MLALPITLKLAPLSATECEPRRTLSALAVLSSVSVLLGTPATTGPALIVCPPPFTFRNCPAVPLTTTVPSAIVRPPVKVSLPCSVSVFAPTFVSADAPLITPGSVMSPPSVTPLVALM